MEAHHGQGGLASGDAGARPPVPARRWKTFAEGWPRCLNVDSVFELDSNVQFSCVRATNFNGLLVFQ